MKKLLTAMALALMLTTPVCNTVSVSADSLLYGDANCDGYVDIKDIAALSQHLIKVQFLTEQGLENCGFFNNEVTIKSLSQVKKYLIQDVEKLQFSYYDDGIYEDYKPFDFDKLQNTKYFPFNNHYFRILIKHQYSSKEKKWNIENFGLTTDEVLYCADAFNSADSKQYVGIHLRQDNEENLISIMHSIDDEAKSGKYEYIEKLDTMPPDTSID